MKDIKKILHETSLYALKLHEIYICQDMDFKEFSEENGKILAKDVFKLKKALEKIVKMTQIKPIGSESSKRRRNKT